MPEVHRLNSPPFSDHDREDSPPNQPARRSSLTRHLATLLLLVIGAIWGTLTRLGLVTLNTYAGQSIFALLWAQAVGCLIMGWASASSKQLDSRYPPLLIGITTGYCGSLTTFSGYVFSAFSTVSNASHFDRTDLHSFLDAWVQTVVTLGFCLKAYDFGANYLHRWLPMWKIFCGWFGSQTTDNREEENALDTDKKHSNRRYNFVKEASWKTDVFFIVFGVLQYLGVALLFVYYPDPNYRNILFPCLFGPPGAWMRWYLSRLNVSATPYESKDKQFYSIPYGTFIANVFAVVLLSFVNSLGTLTILPKTVTQCQILRALSQGFCACLSTVSTFIGEVKKLSKLRSWFYVWSSYWICMVLCVVFVGAPRWSGMEWESKCNGNVTI